MSLISSINLDDWQDNFLKCEGDKILCTGRQVGKSVACGRDAGNWARQNKGKVILMIAPTERQAYGLFEKTLDYLIDTCPNMIKKGKDRPTKTRIILKNGTKIFCLPTGLSGLGIRFLTVHRLYVDEASRVPGEVWAAITPMLLTTGGALILLSTPAGKEGYFWEVWNNNNKAFNSFTRFHVTSKEVIEKRKICKTWTKEQKEGAIKLLEQERKRMTKIQYAQEYEGKFMDEISQFFPTKLILKCCTLTQKHYNGNEIRAQRMKGRHYLGIDVAGKGKDETVLLTLYKRGNRLKQVDLEIKTEQRQTETIRRTLISNERWNFKRIYIDDGGLGVGVFDSLLENPKTKRKVIAINNAARSIEHNSNKSKRILKEDLYNNMLKLMELDNIKFFDDERIKMSLQSIQAEWHNGKLKIWGRYSHIAEAAIRAAWGTKEKSLNVWIR